MKLVLGNHKMYRSLHPTTRILKVYIEALTEFTHVYCPDGLTTLCSLEAVTLKMAPTAGTVGRAHIVRTGGGEEPMIFGVQLKVQCLLDDFLQHFPPPFLVLLCILCVVINYSCEYKGQQPCVSLVIDSWDPEHYLKCC